MISNTVSIDIQKVGNSRVNEIDFENLPFGREFSDHMFVMDYADGKWGTPKIIPFGNIPAPPLVTTLDHFLI